MITAICWEFYVISTIFGNLYNYLNIIQNTKQYIGKMLNVSY
jgi:hypothetical protein